jgi:hypothetical protein
MKSASLLAAALVTLTSLPLVSQQAGAAGQQNTTANAAGIPANPSGNAAGNAGSSADLGRRSVVSRPEEMQPVLAELMGKLDSKSAKLGDAVELRTQLKMKTADGMEIPKGTRIMGHVTSVVAHGKASENALVAVEFDRAELKGGQNVAIRSEIQWVTPPPSTSTADMLRSQDSIGGGVMGNSTQVMGGAQNGGLGNGSSGGMTVSGGMVQLTTRQSQGLSSVADYGVQAPQGSNSPAAGGHVAGSAAGAETAHATGVRGVMLAGDASGSISGTFTALKQNVHLDGGTRVVLEVAPLK